MAPSVDRIIDIMENLVMYIDSNSFSDDGFAVYEWLCMTDLIPTLNAP